MIADAVFDGIRQKERHRAPVRGMKNAAQGMPHAVRQGRHRVAKTQPGDGGRILQVPARVQVRAAANASRQVLKDQVGRLQAQPVGEIVVQRCW